MNILDKIKNILNTDCAIKGYMPNAPDTMIGLFEYTARPPDHAFGGTDINHCVQVRCRDLDVGNAYHLAETASNTLNRYHDAEIAILQSAPILDIGRDSAGRQEYTVNFEIRRY